MKPPLSTHRHRNGVWKWSQAEREYMRVNYPTMPISGMVAFLKRSSKAILMRGFEMGLSRPRNWTKRDLVVLLKRYPAEGASEALAKYLGRTRATLGTMARTHGIHRNQWACSVCLTTPITSNGKCEACGIVWRTVYGHHHSIFRSMRKQSMSYKSMPFFAAWNPDKGGAFKTACRWILANIGARPSTAYSMDVVKHARGFVPGNLRWALRNEQARNKQHRMLGQMTDMEFAVEARRRGWKRAA